MNAHGELGLRGEFSVKVQLERHVPEEEASSLNIPTDRQPLQKSDFIATLHVHPTLIRGRSLGVFFDFSVHQHLRCCRTASFHASKPCRFQFLMFPRVLKKNTVFSWQ